MYHTDQSSSDDEDVNDCVMMNVGPDQHLPPCRVGCQHLVGFMQTVACHAAVWSIRLARLARLARLTRLARLARLTSWTSWLDQLVGPVGPVGPNWQCDFLSINMDELCRLTSLWCGSLDESDRGLALHQNTTKTPPKHHVVLCANQTNVNQFGPECEFYDCAWLDNTWLLFACVDDHYVVDVVNVRAVSLANIDDSMTFHVGMSTTWLNDLALRARHAKSNHPEWHTSQLLSVLSVLSQPTGI